MKVLMFTNTFVPQIGGVTRSVKTLRGELERRGHKVAVVAPAYDGHRHDDLGVLRVPAIRHLTGSDYALPIPMSRHIRDEIEDFSPDIIHAHHPFLLGDTALRTAASLGVPAVYTSHTRYDFYLGPNHSPNGRLARFLRQLTYGFANIADAVIAPSESMRQILVDGGMTSPVRVIPTGIDLARMRSGDGPVMRARLGLAPNDFVVGHLGRLAAEKNLVYLARAVCDFLMRHPEARLIISGRGAEKDAMVQRFETAGVASQVRLLDTLDAADVASFYAAMDVFAFASLSETQGLVVAEAMAAGTPVVVLDAPGVRESVGSAGTLLPADAEPEAFSDALTAEFRLSRPERARRRRAAREAVERFSVDAMGVAVENLYRELVTTGPGDSAKARHAWEATLAGLAAEGALLENMVIALGMAAHRPNPATAP